ncbi:MAG: hypothetical protein ABSF70_06435 [Terracidiphilus sp.]
MKPKSALILLLAIACVLPARALRLDSIPNRSFAPLPVVDIRNEDFQIVAHLFVMPGETMLLNSEDEKPAGGAGYYEALPGDDTVVMIPGKLGLPHLGDVMCPCALHMDKIAWNRAGGVITVAGLRPYLETSLGAKTAIVSDVKHPRIADGKVYFQLKGHGSGEYWVLTRYGQVVQTGGPFGFSDLVRLLLVDILPWVLLGCLAFSLVNAIRLSRQDTYPDKSFLELMQVSFMRIFFWRHRNDQRESEEEEI